MIEEIIMIDMCNYKIEHEEQNSSGKKENAKENTKEFLLHIPRKRK